MNHFTVLISCYILFPLRVILVLIMLLWEVLIQIWCSLQLFRFVLFSLARFRSLPPDSRTGFRRVLWSSPGDSEDPAPTGRSVGSCARAVGRRTWQSAAPPPGGPARSPRSWPEPREHREGERKGVEEESIQTQWQIILCLKLIQSG